MVIFRQRHAADCGILSNLYIRRDHGILSDRGKTAAVYIRIRSVLHLSSNADNNIDSDNCFFSDNRLFDHAVLTDSHSLHND